MIARGNGPRGGTGDGHLLTNLLAGVGILGPGQRQRGAIGFEGVIGPVALILHLEQIALEVKPHRQLVCRVDNEARHRGEEREQGAIHDPLRPDQQG